MATVINIIRSVREYCGNPSWDTLPMPTILNALYGRIDKYRVKLSLTNQNWIIGHSFLTVNTTDNEYFVPDGPEGPVGRPTKVEYYDETFPARNGPEIEIVHLQDSDLVHAANDHWWLSRDTIDESDSEGAYIASAIAFYGVPLKCRIIPRPLQVATYRIWHDAMTVNVPTLSQEPALQKQFHDLLALDTAKMVLPLCKWGQGEMDAITRQDLMTTINQEYREVADIFDQFRRQSKHPDTRLRRPFSMRSYR